jgi:hypothetical protein
MKSHAFSINYQYFANLLFLSPYYFGMRRVLFKSKIQQGRAHTGDIGIDIYLASIRVWIQTPVLLKKKRKKDYFFQSCTWKPSLNIQEQTLQSSIFKFRIVGGAPLR